MGTRVAVVAHDLGVGLIGLAPFLPVALATAVAGLACMVAGTALSVWTSGNGVPPQPAGKAVGRG